MPVIGTAQGTATDADSDDVVPDKAPQKSVVLAATVDLSGPAAQSSPYTTDVLATVAKLPMPDKPYEDTITEGMLSEGVTHSTGDLAASGPTPSQGRSIKETLVFGPSELDARLLNQFHIHPGA